MNRRSILTILIGFIIFMSIHVSISNAASLTIAVSQSEAKEGDKVSVTVNGSGITGKVALSVDEGSIDQSSVWVENSKATAVVTVTGNKDIRITATPVDVSDSTTGEAANVNATGATIKIAQKNSDSTETDNNNSNTPNEEISVAPAQTTPATTQTETKKSNNANLSNLGFTPTDFKGFKAWQTEYSATVKGDVEQVNVYAKVQDSKAKITSGTGTQKLNVGTNSLKVTVTAEDGTTKTYTINVTREQPTENTTEDTNTVNEETTENAEQEAKTSDLTKLEVVGFTLTPAFSPDIYEYKLNVNNDINDLDVKTEGLNENIQIEVAGNKDLQEGENTITVLVHNKDNNTNQTYQILVNKALANNDVLNSTLNEAVKKANKIRTIIIAIVIAIILGIIIFFIAKHKINLEEEENEKYAYDDEDSETIDLDDDEELFKRVNKAEFKKKIKENEVEYKTKRQNTDIELEDDADLDNSTIEEDDEYEETEDYFGTSKGKRKGKHF